MQKRKLSKSSQMVFEVLKEEGPLSSTEIVKRVSCSTRAVRYALRTLLDNNFVEKHPCLDDMRKTVYSAKEQIKGETIVMRRIM